MSIKKHELEKMNELVINGSTISQISRKYPAYDYWEIYWAVSDFSFLGKKRTITNRVNSIVKSKSSKERAKIAKEANALITELYNRLKTNSQKLRDIDRTLRK